MNDKIRQKNNKIDSLQMLRALAVLLVIHVHCMHISTPVIGSSYQSNFFYFDVWGSIGVDIFFVISGFIMTIVTPAYYKEKGWKEFIIKRAIRIIPLYWALSFAQVLLSLRHGEIAERESIIKTIFFFPTWSSSIFAYPILGQGWTLSLELFFYSLIALLLIFFKKNINHYLIIAIFTLTIIGFVINPLNSLSKFLTTPLLLEFCLGIIVGMIYKYVLTIYQESNKKVIRLGAIILFIVGLSLMITSIFTGYKAINYADIVGDNMHLALFRSLIWGVPCGMLVCSIVILERVYLITVPGIFIKIGDASYSGYLIHTWIIIYYLKFYKFTELQNQDLFVLSCTVLCIVLSIPFYKYIEKPLIVKIMKLVNS